MGWKIVWTEPALFDLAEAVRFIASDDPDAAIRVGNLLVEHVEILHQFPESGSVYRQRAKGTVRQLVHRPFRIFYRIRNESGCVEILHVWHGARQEPNDLR